MIKLTIHKGSIEFGVSRETLTRGLRANGLDVERGNEFTVREMHAALAGDLKKARTRESVARAAMLEAELQEKKKILVPLDEVRRLIVNTFQPIRDILNELPSTQAVLCNPTDPTQARLALEEWLKRIMPLIRQSWPTRAEYLREVQKNGVSLTESKPAEPE